MIDLEAARTAMRRADARLAVPVWAQLRASLGADWHEALHTLRTRFGDRLAAVRATAPTKQATLRDVASNKTE